MEQAYISEELSTKRNTRVARLALWNRVCDFMKVLQLRRRNKYNVTEMEAFFLICNNLLFWPSLNMKDPD